MSRKVVISALIGVLAFGTFGAGMASSAGNPHDKVWVCHGTSSEQTPWILIHIDRDGWTNGHEGEGAHAGHPADDFLFDDNPDKDAHPHGPAGTLLCEEGQPPTDPGPV